MVPFDTRDDVRGDSSDTILSLSERLAKYGGGGTDCTIRLRKPTRSTASAGLPTACW